MTDAKLMKTVRNQLELTQSQMADQCGYGSQTRISDIETGRENMSGPARKLPEMMATKRCYFTFSITQAMRNIQRNTSDFAMLFPFSFDFELKQKRPSWH